MTTAAPTTVPATTVAPTTAVPTTIGPTTIPGSTVPPTTIAGIDLDFGPIVITVQPPYAVWHYWPPAPVNAGLDQEANWGPIEITMSVEGTPGNVGIDAGAIDIVVTPLVSSLRIGQVIEAGPIVITISLPPKDIIIDQNLCNWIKWSKVGELDFTIDESNLAGERPLDWRGCVYHIEKLGSLVCVYGANGVSILRPSGVHWGMDTIYRIGLKNKGAFAGSDEMHFFVDILNQLWIFSDKLQKLDYKEFISTLGTTILSFDKEQGLLYICDGTSGFIYSVDSGSFGKGPATVTGLGVQSGNLYVGSSAIISTPKFEICTDIYDFGTRKPKTITEVSIGTDLSQYMFASADYRVGYKDDFKQIGWFLVNPGGTAYPKCYGVEFRFRFKSMIYEYFELDYVRVRGHVHGYSYLDAVG